jgi:hypothetical protein
MVEHPTAKVGTIQWIDGLAVQPNQNNPIGSSVVTIPAKYSRRSGVRGPWKYLAVSWSCQMLMSVARMDPIDIASSINVCNLYGREWGKNNGAYLRRPHNFAELKSRIVIGKQGE